MLLVLGLMFVFVVACRCCFVLLCDCYCLCFLFICPYFRGCIFIFNFHTKRYWRHKEKVQKPNVAAASRKEHNQYVIGTKEGVLVLLDVGKYFLSFIEIF